MADQEYIYELKEYLVNKLHDKRIKQQKEDQTYYDDTFKVPMIKKPFTVYRSGRGARMVDGPAEHIITSNPQVFRKDISKSEAEIDRNKRVVSELNRWIRFYIRQIDEIVKTCLLRGEVWWRSVENEAFAQTQIPVLVEVPDPITVFANYNDEINGIPKEVIVWGKRSVDIIKWKFPNWDSKEHLPGAEVDWLEYLSADQWYCEAAQKVVKNVKNVLGFVPLVHCFSSFGKSSYDGKPEALTIGRLTKIRDVLMEQCAIRSDIASIMHRYAYPHIDLIVRSGQEPAGDVGENYDMSPQAFNTLMLGVGDEIKEGVVLPPKPEQFQHLYNIEKFLSQDDPPILSGISTGTSGRQEDIVGGYATRRYDKLVENVEQLVATGLGQCMKMTEKIRAIRPKALNEGDINGNYQCTVELKADDPIEKERLSARGSRMYQRKEIDLMTNLVEYQGYTEEEAQNKVDQLIVDDVTINNPDFRAIMGLRMAKKMGLEDELRGIQAMGQEKEKRQQAFRETEVQTDLGREMPDMSLTEKGIRSSPEPYTRGER